MTATTWECSGMLKNFPLLKMFGNRGVTQTLWNEHIPWIYYITIILPDGFRNCGKAVRKCWLVIAAVVSKVSCDVRVALPHNALMWSDNIKCQYLRHIRIMLNYIHLESGGVQVYKYSRSIRIISSILRFLLLHCKYNVIWCHVVSSLWCTEKRVAAKMKTRERKGHFRLSQWIQLSKIKSWRQSVLPVGWLSNVSWFILSQCCTCRIFSC